MRIATPAFFFWFLFAWSIFFHPLTISLYVSLGLKWVSCRQHMYGSYFIYLFIFGCVRCLLLCTGFVYLQRVAATLRCGAWASHCGGFSCCGTGGLGVRASLVVAHGLSCSAACEIFPDQGQTCVPCVGRQTLNHCATRESPCLVFVTIQPVYVFWLEHLIHLHLR